MSKDNTGVRKIPKPKDGVLGLSLCPYTLLTTLSGDMYPVTALQMTGKRTHDKPQISAHVVRSDEIGFKEILA